MTAPRTSSGTSAGVMWQVTRVRLDRVGAAAARFLDVTIDLADDSGLPLDSIVWLRNGGGKSTVLSLMCALIRPHRRDFLATSATDKHLEDYVLGADTAHVTLEWSGPAGRRLVTGALYEWADRTQPADPNRDYEKLQTWWYAFAPVPGRAELDLLPFTGADGQPTPLKEFAAAVRGWDPIPGCGATVTDRQDRWARVLDDHGLDPELFTAILQMNATEGGIEGQFQFRNADAFVKYLLELIIDPDVPREVSQILESVRAGLAERPALLADLTFADEAVPQLQRLSRAREEHQQAAEFLCEVREAADALRQQLIAAAECAESAAHTAATKETEQKARLARSRRARDTAYNRSVELRRVAAQYRRDAALADQETAQGRSADATALLEAWQAVPRLQALAGAQQRVRFLEHQLQSATLEAEPLRLARDAAAAHLAAALDAAVAELTAQANAAEERGSSERVKETAAKRRGKESTAEHGRLQERLTALREALDVLNREVAAAVEAGHLEPGEDLSAALGRHRQADADTEAELTRAVDARSTLTQRRKDLALEEQDLRLREAEATRDLDGAMSKRAALQQRVDELAADERLHLLAATDDLDVLAEAEDLIAALGEHITRADRRRVEIAVAGAEDDRAAAALSTTGLLPPVLDVAAALAECDKAQLAATSGWAYLADSVPAALRARVLAAAPALAGGVLVHSPADLSVAQELLTSAALRPTSPVAVATTVDLQAVVEQVQADAAGRTFVVPPAAALTDRAAAGDELRLRELARGDRDSEDMALQQQRAADEELRRALRELLRDCPPGTLAALDDEVAQLEEQLRQLSEHLGAVPDRRAALDAEDDELTAREGVAHAARQRAAAAAAVVEGLLPRMAAADGQRAEAARLPSDIARAAAAVVEADRNEVAAAAAAKQAEDDERTRRDLMQELGTERAQLGDVEPADEPAPLVGARQAWAVADAAYRKETSESALAAAVDEARRAVAAPAAEVTSLPAARRARAEELAASPAAADPQLTAGAIRDAERQAAQRLQGLNDATVELTLAEKEVTEHTPTDRLRHAQLEPSEVPASREAALAAAVQAEAERDEHLAAENEAQAQAAQAADEARLEASRAESLRNAALLLGGSREDAAAEGAEPYAGTVEQARSKVDALRERLQTQQHRTAELLTALQGVSTALALWANEDRFLSVKPDVRGRFRVTDVGGELGPVAAALADDLVVCAANLRGRLEELEEHKKVVVAAMTGMVRQALRTIERAQRLSELPESLGPWAGQRFLEVAPRASVDTSEAIVRDRCSRLVDSLSSRGSEVPRGLELLWQATSAVVGDGNWKARVLKPSTTFAVDRVSVEKMRKWSGGEKVTISLLLFCMVAKLRAQNRGRDLPGLGVLPLDNPLGKANYVVFLDLQRKVAAANGVQLLFLTGVGDMKAVGRFPNIVRMRNTANRSREYVRVAERLIAGADPAGVVDATRVWRDDPVLKLL